MEAISFAVTIALGVISVGLGGFAVWLSLKFNEQSNRALREIDSVVGELRSVTNASIDHQRQFSSRMLDSLLAGPYGESPPLVGRGEAGRLENLLREELRETEGRIIDNLDEFLSASATAGVGKADLEARIQSITRQIQALSDQAVETVAAAAEIRPEVRVSLDRLRSFPGHYSILWAVLTAEISSTRELGAQAARFGVPEPVESGVQNLIDEHILDGDLDGFRIPEADRPALAAWVDRNLPWLQQLKEVHEWALLNEGVPDSDAHLKKMERVRSVAAQIRN